MTGTVVTFYSYKGGVGRSFAMANIAVLLARWGRRVLCVDWDLEAPGLYDYFRPMLSAEPASGVIDIVEDFQAGEFRPADHVTRLTGVGALDLIAAGRDTPDYIGRLQRIDWEHLYDENFGEYLEQCRAQWTADYDFVLIDSRTGISDSGSICTAHLPDRLVLVYTANRQSVRGVADVARRATVSRDRLPYDRAQLTVLPLLSRFDSREEYSLSEMWRRDCLDVTEGLFGNWLDRRVSPETMSRLLTLPYVSYWSFGEQIAVDAEREPAADQISYSLETVAALIAQDFDRTALLAENRDSYVAAMRTAKREFAHDFRVSTPRSTLDFATKLINHLNTHGVRAELSLATDRAQLNRHADDARHLCLLVDKTMSKWQQAEAEVFLHRTLGQDRRVIPVLRPNAEPSALPGQFGNLRYLRSGPDRGPAEIAQALVDQLNGVDVLADPVDLAAVLRRALDARLRPLLWGLVDDVAAELLVAVRAADDDKARDLGTDLALVVRPRHDEEAQGHRVVAPPLTKSAIEWVLSALDARRKEPGRKDLE
jgi:hypothetical protein